MYSQNGVTGDKPPAVAATTTLVVSMKRKGLDEPPDTVRRQLKLSSCNEAAAGLSGNSRSAERFAAIGGAAISTASCSSG